ncbi:MAG: glycosyltransferase [Clostridia bacterium]|nr:glycosyltransferase [Clostridia bacterium]
MNKLIFVTSKYPFASGETFIENEIKYLSEAFDKVYIFASEAEKNENIRPVPENVSVFCADRENVSKMDYLPELFKINNIKEIFKNCLGKNLFAKTSAVCYFSACVTKSLKNVDDFIESCDIKSGDTVTVYSYWLSTIGMCAIKIAEKLKNKGIKLKLISRCHRFDIYSERNDINYLPFFEKQLSCFDFVYPCSKYGEDYIKNRYPEYKDKVIAKFLGVTDKFNGIFPKKDDTFNIVSCSNVIPLKRVDKITKALTKITDKKISWTHFGDGKLFDTVKSEAENILPENISVSFMGRVPNTQIYDYYNNHNVNLFINVSTTEGLPVSIMEAVSFGIPVIATDVGGTGEIAEDGKNSCLLPENFDISELSQAICNLINMDEEKYIAFCNYSRNLFDEKFNAKKTFSDFTKTIKF